MPIHGARKSVFATSPMKPCERRNEYSSVATRTFVPWRIAAGALYADAEHLQQGKLLELKPNAPEAEWFSCDDLTEDEL